MTLAVQARSALYAVYSRHSVAGRLTTRILLPLLLLLQVPLADSLRLPKVDPPFFLSRVTCSSFTLSGCCTPNVAIRNVTSRGQQKRKHNHLAG